MPQKLANLKDAVFIMFLFLFINYSIQIEEFPTPGSRLVPLTGSGMRWMAWGINPVISGDYHARMKKWFVKINKRGSVTITGEDMSFFLDFKVGEYFFCPVSKTSAAR